MAQGGNSKIKLRMVSVNWNPLPDENKKKTTEIVTMNL